MSSYSAYGAPAAGVRPSPWVDPGRRGSPMQQAMTGLVGIVLAAVLVIGQISVATTAGLQQNLHSNIKHLKDGNVTMRAILEKSFPSVLMEKVVRHQYETLASTEKTMGVLNGHMAAMAGTTSSLTGTVEQMRKTSATLASGVEGMNQDTQRIVKLLEPLPGATGRTHKQLGQISGDSAAINGELAAISAKMVKYGLPHATNVRKRPT